MRQIIYNQEEAMKKVDEMYRLFLKKVLHVEWQIETVDELPNIVYSHGWLLGCLRGLGRNHILYKQFES